MSNNKCFQYLNGIFRLNLKSKYFLKVNDLDLALLEPLVRDGSKECDLPLCISLRILVLLLLGEQCSEALASPSCSWEEGWRSEAEWADIDPHLKVHDYTHALWSFRDSVGFERLARKGTSMVCPPKIRKEWDGRPQMLHKAECVHTVYKGFLKLSQLRLTWSPAGLTLCSDSGLIWAKRG